MKIGLYNVDSVIPNLALMKLSAYHKARGDDVAWYLPLESYDKVYASKVFTDSHIERNNGMVVGGSGCADIKKTLPPEIDYMKPDYSIYPDCDYSIGFTTRGCIRKCEFCFVPEKEGKIQEYRKVSDIWRGKGNLVLLDNNILAMPEKFGEVLEFCKAKKIHVDFNQGLDCRLVTKELADLIIKYKPFIQPEVRFAFDDLSYRKAVERTCKMLPFRCHWYVYCDENWESTLERLLVLKRQRVKQVVYVMRNKRVTGKGFHKWSILANWANGRVAYPAMDIYDYIAIKNGSDTYKKQLQGQESLWET